MPSVAVVEARDDYARWHRVDVSVWSCWRWRKLVSTFVTEQWLLKLSGKPIYGRVSGPLNRLDLIVEPRVSEQELGAHGIIGSLTWKIIIDVLAPERARTLMEIIHVHLVHFSLGDAKGEALLVVGRLVDEERVAHARRVAQIIERFAVGAPVRKGATLECRGIFGQ